MKLHEATAPTNLTGPLRLARLINEARTLTGPEKDLLRAMMQWINPQTLCLHPSVKRLAAAIGKSDRTVQRLLNGLADKGAISIERRSGGSPLATNKVRWNPSAWQSEEPTLFGSIAPEAGGGQENTGDTHVTGLSMSPVTPVSLTGDTHVTRTSKRTSKQQQGGTPPPPLPPRREGSASVLGSAAAAASRGEGEGKTSDPDLRRELVAAGIGQPTLGRLLRTLRLAPDRVRAIADSARQRGKGTGIVVRDLEAADARLDAIAARRAPSPLSGSRSSQHAPAPTPEVEPEDSVWARAARGLTYAEVAILARASERDGPELRRLLARKSPRQSRQAATQLGEYLESLAPLAGAIDRMLARVEAVTPEESSVRARGVEAIRAKWPSSWCAAAESPLDLEILEDPAEDPWDAFALFASAAGCPITPPRRVLAFPTPLETSGAQQLESGNPAEVGHG